MNKSSLQILHLNTQSIISNNKSIQLHSIISKHKPQFSSFNKTFLKSNLSFELEGYNIFRADRVIQRGGGALLGVQNKLLGEQIDLTNLCETPLT